MDKYNNIYNVSIGNIKNPKILNSILIKKNQLFSNDFLDFHINNPTSNSSDEHKNIFAGVLNYRNDLNNRKERFLKSKSLNDLADSLGFSSGVYHFINRLNDSEKYISFTIPKKNGKPRMISRPINSLMFIQNKLNEVLSEILNFKSSVHGFVKNRSILSNAKVHLKRKYILNIDLKDFFPSVNFGRIRGLFMSFPFNFNTQIATIIARICCINNQLPQGAPTSPIISNLICRYLDVQLFEFSKNKNCLYTRYADDITISSNNNIFNNTFLSNIKNIIEKNGFLINEDKLRINTPYNRKEVTGIIVNEKLNVKRRYLKLIRAILYNWEKKGYEDAQKSFYSKFLSKYLLNHSSGRLETSLKGMIDFVGFVRGKEDILYLSFLHKLNTLSKSEQSSTKKKVQKTTNEQSNASSTSEEKTGLSEDHKKHIDMVKHHPIKHSLALLLFTERYRGLKYLVHFLDIDYDSIRDNVEKAEKELEDNKYLLDYLFYINVKQQLISYYKEVVLKNNSGFINGITYKRKILTFKKIYKIGNSNDSVKLNDLIVEICKKNALKPISYEIDVNNVSFFTDVHRMKKGLNVLINNIIQQNHFKKVIFKLSEDKILFNKKKFKKFILSIINQDSVSEESVDDIVNKLNHDYGDVSELKSHSSAYNYLYNLCDWSFEGKFKDNKIYVIDVLNYKNRKQKVISKGTERVNYFGFTHNLSFYRNV